jgi:hypothetical protein
MELDSSTSSAALLMNVFCYPSIIARVGGVLGISQEPAPVFGFKARVPLKNGRADRTEVDMRLSGLLIETKLTETELSI